MKSSSDSASTLNLINLDDNEDEGHALWSFLSKIDGLGIEFERLGRPDQAPLKLLSGEVNLLPLHHELGSSNTGLDVLRYVRNEGYDGPVVMPTNREVEALMANCLRYGADAHMCRGRSRGGAALSYHQDRACLPHMLTPRLLSDETGGPLPGSRPS